MKIKELRTRLILSLILSLNLSIFKSHAQFLPNYQDIVDYTTTEESVPMLLSPLNEAGKQIFSEVVSKLIYNGVDTSKCKIQCDINPSSYGCQVTVNVDKNYTFVNTSERSNSGIYKYSCFKFNHLDILVCMQTINAPSVLPFEKPIRYGAKRFNYTGYKYLEIGYNPTVMAFMFYIELDGSVRMTFFADKWE